jgi:hypothetical protein
MEETTTFIGFGVERHTLAYQRYHPVISLCHLRVFSFAVIAQLI